MFAKQDMERYVEALIREIGETAGSPACADSLYFGGGTPSLLTAGQLGRIFQALNSRFTISANPEITLEAAPGSITPELAASWQELGINRVSLGVQSFVERELKAVGRPHRAATVAGDLELLGRAGIHNANIDLIAGLPRQSMATWNESLDWIARLCPAHVSVYILEIDEDSRLGKEVLSLQTSTQVEGLVHAARYSAAEVPDEDAMADYYCQAIDRLEAIGCRQYEISNFAMPGRESRHNRKYWEHVPYLGLGLDAHSFSGIERWENSDSLEDYLNALENGRSPVVARNALDERRRAEERIFLGLRQNQGIELTADEHERYRLEIDKMAHAGLLELSGDRLCLTRRGRLLSNEVFAEFIDT